MRTWTGCVSAVNLVLCSKHHLCSVVSPASATVVSHQWMEGARRTLKGLLFLQRFSRFYSTAASGWLQSDFAIPPAQFPACQPQPAAPQQTFLPSSKPPPRNHQRVLSLSFGGEGGPFPSLSFRGFSLLSLEVEAARFLCYSCIL